MKAIPEQKQQNASSEGGVRHNFVCGSYMRNCY
jgi:hypothetical protein